MSHRDTVPRWPHQCRGCAPVRMRAMLEAWCEDTRALIHRHMTYVYMHPLIFFCNIRTWQHRHTDTNADTRKHTRKRTPTHGRTHTHTHTRTHAHAHTHAHTRARTHTSHYITLHHSATATATYSMSSDALMSSPTDSMISISSCAATHPQPRDATMHCHGATQPVSGQRACWYARKY